MSSFLTDLPATHVPRREVGPIERQMRERAAGARARLIGGVERTKPIVIPQPKPRPVEIVVTPTKGVPVDLLSPPSWRVLAKLVALRHGVHLRDIVGQNRTVPVVAARHEAIHLVFGHCDYSLPRIGRYFGNRDHTTVLHAVRKVERERSGVVLVPAGVKGQQRRAGSTVDNSTTGLRPHGQIEDSAQTTKGTDSSLRPSPRFEQPAAKRASSMSQSVRSAQ